jgi:hypothetical protein
VVGFPNHFHARDRAVTLLIILVLVTLVLFALFLGGTLVAQGYLYQAPVDRLPLRALLGALLVAVFITIWVWIDKRHPRKYDTFFEFAPYETKTFDEFEAIRWMSYDGATFKKDASGNKVETTVKCKRGVGAKANSFFDEATGDEFKLNTSTAMTVALKLIPDPKHDDVTPPIPEATPTPKQKTEPKGEAVIVSAPNPDVTSAQKSKQKPEPKGDVVRFNARLTPDQRAYATDQEGWRFDEEKGSRYILADKQTGHVLGVMYIPSTGTVILALLLNVLHFVVWFAVFWPILQFTRGHAFILAVSFGLIMMILILPLLFKPNRTPPVAEAPKVAVLVTSNRGQSGG